MKREALNHTKMKRLCRRLDVPIYHGVGILESLWQLTAREAPRGDIGKLSNEDIIIGIDYREDEDDLIESLISAGWVDRSEEFRLVIHDWDEHADDAVHMRLARSRAHFCTGRAPKLARLGGKERTDALAYYMSCAQTEDPCAQNIDPCAPPRQSPASTPPEPEPVPEPMRAITKLQPRWPYLADAEYLPFVVAACEFWPDLIEEDLQRSWLFTWKKFDFEQKTDCVIKLRARIEAGEDGHFVTRPPKYLEGGDWKRPPRKPSGGNSRESVTDRAIRVGEERMRAQGRL